MQPLGSCRADTAFDPRPVLPVTPRDMDAGDSTKSHRELLAEIAELRSQLARARGETGRAPTASRLDHAALAKSAVESLRHTDERFQSCVENMLDCFGMFSAARDAAGRIVDFRVDYLNRAACAENGRPLDEQLGRGLTHVLPAQPAGGLLDALRRVDRTGQPVEVESLEYEQGRPEPRRLARAFEIRAWKLEDGFAASWRDITARKRDDLERHRVDEEVRRRQILLASVLDSTDDTVFIKDAHGRYLLMNRAGCELARKPADDILGRTDAELFPGEPPDRLARVREDDRRAVALPPGQALRFEETVATPHGPRHFLTTKTAYRDADGRVLGLIGIARDVTDLQATGDALRRETERARASETLYRELADHMPQIVWTARPDGYLDYYNRRWYEVAGAPPDRYGDESWSPAVHPEDLAAVAECWARAVRTGEPMTGNEFRLLDARSGTFHWHLGRATPIRDPAGQIVRWIGTTTDIHDHKVAQAAALEGARQHRALFEALPTIAWVNRPDGAVDYFNSLWTQYTGLGERPTGLEWLSAIHPDDVAQTVSTRAAAIARGEGYEVDLRFRRASDGAYRWHQCRVVPLHDAAGRRFAWLGTAADVDDRRRAEEALRVSAARFREVADAMPQMVWVTRPDGFHEHYNHQWYEFTGVPEGSTDGEAWNGVFHPDDQARAWARWRHSLETGEPYEIEYRLRHRSGQYRWTLGRALAIRDDAGRIVRWIGTCTDIHEQKLLHDALDAARQEAERANRAKDEFLAALSHELRTPLAPVLLTTQMLESDAALPESVRQDLGVIRRNVEIEVRLIDDLLDLTRIARGKVHLQSALADVHAVLRHAADTSRDDLFLQKRLTLRLDLAAQSSGVWADSARLAQVFWNLIKNAVKFTPEGGAITVRTSNPRPGRIAVAVEDTGVGIDPDVLPGVFDAFEQGGSAVTRQFGGLGLGLAISRALVEMHGGSITAASPGRGLGATFAVEFPTRELAGTAASPRAVTTSRTPAATPAGRRILLVEDHHQTGKVLRRLLTTLGYQVEWADTAAAARRAAAAAPFDLVVSDVGLPDGTGHDLMRELRARHALRGIALTGYGMEDDLARSAESGFLRHLVKPVSLDVLRTTLRELLG